MSFAIDAWSVVVVAVAGTINKEQAKVIDYLQAENRVLKDIVKGRVRGPRDLIGCTLPTTNGEHSPPKQRTLAAKPNASSRRSSRRTHSCVGIGDSSPKSTMAPQRDVLGARA